MIRSYADFVQGLVRSYFNKNVDQTLQIFITILPRS